MSYLRITAKTLITILLFNFSLIGQAKAARTVMEAIASTNNSIYVSSLTTRVGIGTSTPAVTMDVNGDAQFGSGVTKSSIAATGEASFITSTLGPGNALVLKNQDAHDMNSVGIVFQVNTLSGGSFSITRIISTNTSASDSAGALLLQTRAVGSGPLVTALIINSAQRIGIGTLLPASLLHVSSGTLIIDGNGSPSIDTTEAIGIGRFTTAQVQAKTPQRAGQLIYNTTVGVLCISTGTTVEGYARSTVGSASCQ